MVAELPHSEPGLYLCHRDRGFVAHMIAGQSNLSRVRSLTASVLLSYGAATETVAAAQLVLSELVSNAVRAGGDDVPLAVEVYASDAGVAVNVHDPVRELLPQFGESAMDSDEAVSGRGLHLLALLCSDFSVATSGIGKQVRCLLAPR
ncbi:ATP-binding protein [Streptomyces sp. MS2.AVA.5]|uniref:ATP-binding protein n=1 Tax=Streptomyces achmelvichensis TaxID=3134111 RepID=A0ACC6PM22_9ACTN